eukprot:TRINITY_DN2357_c0_g1_i3.p1 TRINITY_DN2357_c0_g1~~TRINITY_DN2357_c0_g1_i3.p1  ORF type:complete len:383 (-),score=97.83 TRINITY_DN2357_c0_g1_i3:256-1299(-)
MVGDAYDRPYPNSERDDILATPASRLSRSKVERIVSMPFPNAPARPTQDVRSLPDERDDIIVELRATVSRLEQRVKGLETEKKGLQGTVAHLKDDNEQLRRELGRMTKALEEERALTQVNLGSEEMRRREAFELVDLQRRLLLLKDEEVRQLGQLAAAQREQVFILQSHLASEEINAVLAEAFDPLRVDLGTLDPDCRSRVTELLRASNLEGRLDLGVDRKVLGPGPGASGGVRTIPAGAPRGKGPAFRPKKPVYAANRAAAGALDAADGVIDGRYEGAEILVPTSNRGGSVYADDRLEAQQLDAADGVIDGRFQGHNILVPKGGSSIKQQLSAARAERERIGGKYR